MLYSFLVYVWILFGNSSFLPESKDMDRVKLDRVILNPCNYWDPLHDNELNKRKKMDGICESCKATLEEAKNKNMALEIYSIIGPLLLMIYQE